MPRTLASAMVLSVASMISRTFFRFGTKGVEVEGLPTMLEALREGNMDVAVLRQDGSSAGSTVNPASAGPSRRRRGIVTVCNHNSVVDDPMAWASLPQTNLFPFTSPTTTSRNTRWTLGARDIMFTNPYTSKFFDLGQVISTERGGGVFQPAMDKAVKLLQDGEWIHIFPEGKVNQQKFNPPGGMIRFKWGIGRIIMDSEVMPEIIPMWISGFDQIMPETRTWPRPIPRLGAKITITYGPSLTPKIQPLVDEWRKIASREKGTVGLGGVWEKEGDSPEADEQRAIRSRGSLAGGKEEEMRIRITNEIQKAIREMGEVVEEREGRYARKEWSQSRAGVHL